jgi:hypothetical protein
MGVFLTALLIWTVIFGFFTLKILSKDEPRFKHTSRIVGNFREGGWIIALSFFIVDIVLSSMFAFIAELISNAR